MNDEKHHVVQPHEGPPGGFLILKLEHLRAALRAIAYDDELECRCGTPPYDNGVYCPKCTAYFALYPDGDDTCNKT